MSAPKHTAGPWTVQYETDITGIENDPSNGCSGPVDVAHVYLRTVPGRTEANARLIAAAPDMLHALRRAVLALAFASESFAAMRDDYEAVSAAIAKATGAEV